jgi:hypothetical protein
MSTQNLTQISSGGGQPPNLSRKGRTKPKQTADIAFGRSKEDEGLDTLTVWQGLRGVCKALDDLHALSSNSIDTMADLGAAARVLAELMEDRLMISPAGFRELSIRV